MQEEIQQKKELVWKLLTEVSEQYAAELKRNGLDCFYGCGSCCFTETVEATVVEFLPLAFYFHERGELEEELKKIEEAVLNDQKICIFYSSDSENGRCTIYPYRAFICRTFGVFKVTDKHQKEVISLCHKMKKKNYSIPSELNLPSLVQWRQVFSSHFGVFETQLLPINQAIRDCFRQSLFKLSLLDKLKS